jgi:hypothetical protein
MAWVIARQHRFQLMGMCALTAILGLAALASELPIQAAYHQHALAQCLPPSNRSGCDLIVTRFLNQYSASAAVTRYLSLVPLLAGIFVGAPLLAREFEHGTHRLAWTQSVTRQRWLLGKVIVLVAATALAGAAVAVIAQWWRQPFDALNGRMSPPAFDVEGIVVPAYAIFALALGLLLGLILRRTIAAMTIAAAGFVAVRLVVEKLLRPHYLTPLTTEGAGVATPVLPRDWVIRDALVTSTGRPVTASLQDSAVVHAQRAQIDAAAYMSQLGYKRVVSFQPDERFWTFQAIEAGIFVLLALIALGAAVWLVRRTPS